MVSRENQKPAALRAAGFVLTLLIDTIVTKSALFILKIFFRIFCVIEDFVKRIIAHLAVFVLRVFVLKFIVYHHR